MQGATTWTVKDIQRIYSVSRETVYRWMREGMPRLTFPRRAVRFDPADVQEWIRFGKERQHV